MDFKNLPKSVIKIFDEVRGLSDNDLQNLYQIVVAEVNTGNNKLNHLKLRIEDELKARGLL